MLYDSVANFIRLPAVQTFWKSVKIWWRYREFKGGNFLRHSVVFTLFAEYISKILCTTTIAVSCTDVIQKAFRFTWHQGWSLAIHWFLSVCSYDTGELAGGVESEFVSWRWAASKYDTAGRQWRLQCYLNDRA